MIVLVRSSVSREHSSGRSEVDETDPGKYSQLLSVEAKALGSACSQMAMVHSDPEEMLLSLTHSFHTLCCLTQACMSLLDGPGSPAQQRAVGATVDELILNYVCLLHAAEAAWDSVPSGQSVNTLARHSATMSAIVNTLTSSLKTLFSK